MPRKTISVPITGNYGVRDSRSTDRLQPEITDKLDDILEIYKQVSGQRDWKIVAARKYDFLERLPVTVAD